MNKAYKAMIVSFFVNASLVIMKLVTGIITNYKTLIADAIHSFSDLSTDIVAIIGQKIAYKKADKKHPYGHGKIEYITSIIIGIVIMFLGLKLIYTTMMEEVSVTGNYVFALIIVLITIIFKYFLAKYVYKTGKEINNSILIASSKESYADVLSSIGVFITIVLFQFKDSFGILKYADRFGGIIISILIIKTAFNILKDNLTAVIGECEHDEKITSNIEDIIMSITDVLAIDSLTIMKFGSYYQIVLDVGVDGECKLKEAHDIAHNIEKKLLDSEINIKYVSVHVNPHNKALDEN